MQVITTAADLGAAIGAVHGGAKASCIAVHRVYVKATDDVKADMRRDFKVNYVVRCEQKQGRTCTHEQATKAVDAGKRGAGKWGDAVNAASAACTLYLANGGVKKPAVNQTPKVVVPRALHAEITALLETYTKEQIKAALK